MKKGPFSDFVIVKPHGEFGPRRDSYTQAVEVPNSLKPPRNSSSAPRTQEEFDPRSKGPITRRYEDTRPTSPPPVSPAKPARSTLLAQTKSTKKPSLKKDAGAMSMPAAGAGPMLGKATKRQSADGRRTQSKVWLPETTRASILDTHAKTPLTPSDGVPLAYSRRRAATADDDRTPRIAANDDRTPRMKKAGEVALPRPKTKWATPRERMSRMSYGTRSKKDTIRSRRAGIKPLGTVTVSATKSFKVLSLDAYYDTMKAEGDAAAPAPQGSGPPKKFPKRNKPSAFEKTKKALSNPYASLIGPEAVAAGEKKDKEIDERAHVQMTAHMKRLAAANPKLWEKKTKKALATGYGKVSGGGALKAPNRGYFEVSTNKGGAFKPTPIAARVPKPTPRSAQNPAIRKPPVLDIGNVKVEPRGAALDLTSLKRESVPKPVLDIGNVKVERIAKPTSQATKPKAATPSAEPPRGRTGTFPSPSEQASINREWKNRDWGAGNAYSHASVRVARRAGSKPSVEQSKAPAWMQQAKKLAGSKRTSPSEARSSAQKGLRSLNLNDLNRAYPTITASARPTTSSKKSPRALDAGGAALLNSMSPPTLMKPKNVVQKSEPEGTSTMSKTNFNDLFKSELGIPNDAVLCSCPHCDTPITKSDFTAKGEEQVGHPTPPPGSIEMLRKPRTVDSKAMKKKKLRSSSKFRAGPGGETNPDFTKKADGHSYEALDSESVTDEPVRKSVSVRGTDWVQYVDDGSDAALAKAIAEGGFGGTPPTQPIDLNNDLTRLLV